MYVCMYVCMYACMHACMYMYVYVYVYMYVCVYIYIYIYIYSRSAWDCVLPRAECRGDEQQARHVKRLVAQTTCLTTHSDQAIANIINHAHLIIYNIRQFITSDTLTFKSPRSLHSKMQATWQTHKLELRTTDPGCNTEGG